MSKSLLVEYTPFNLTSQLINESIAKNNGILMVEGVIQRAGAKNHNGRVYPKDILQSEVEKYIEGPVAERRAYGELDHSNESSY
jgi:hypothetical protein